MMYVSRRQMKLFTMASILFVGINAAYDGGDEESKEAEPVINSAYVAQRQADGLTHFVQQAPGKRAVAKTSEKGGVGYLRIFVGLQLKPEIGGDNYNANWGCSQERALEYLRNGKLGLTGNKDFTGSVQFMFRKIDTVIENYALRPYLAEVFGGVNATRVPVMIDTKDMVMELAGFDWEDPDFAKMILWRPFDFKIETIDEALAARWAIEKTSQKRGTVEQGRLVEQVTHALHTRHTEFLNRVGKQWNVSYVACRGPFCDGVHGMDMDRTERNVDQYVEQDQWQIRDGMCRVIKLEAHASLAKDFGLPMKKIEYGLKDVPVEDGVEKEYPEVRVAEDGANELH